jgi:hypothetical protein
VGRAVCIHLGTPRALLKQRYPAAIAARKEKPQMLWTIFVVMLLLWLLGMITSYTLGGFIHILLVIAIAAVLIRLIQGRRAV